MTNSTKIIHKTEATLGTPANATQINIQLEEDSFKYGNDTQIGFSHTLTLKIGERTNSSQSLTLTINGVENPTDLEILGNNLLELAEKLQQRQEMLKKAEETLKSLG